MWSRLPLDERATLPTVNNSIDVLVGAPGGLFRLVVVHTPTPFDDLGGWADDLELVGGVVAAGGEPIVLIGDLNATTWHPAVRAMFANGCSDALAAVGQPFASSWPAGAIVPPFAQLDHALVGPDVVVADAGNFPIPGSDHRGLEVTVRSMR